MVFDLLAFICANDNQHQQAISKNHSWFCLFLVTCRKNIQLSFLSVCQAQYIVLLTGFVPDFKIFPFSGAKKHHGGGVWIKSLGWCPRHRTTREYFETSPSHGCLYLLFFIMCQVFIFFQVLILCVCVCFYIRVMFYYVYQ